MNYLKLGHKWSRFGFFILSILSLLGISATYFLAGEPVFLPLVNNLGPTLTQTPIATITPTPTITSTPGPSATPMPVSTVQLKVTPADPNKDGALAFFAKSYNSAGRPIMQVYPSDTSPISERIKIPKDTIVLALATPVIADGGGKFWQLVDYKGRDGEVLFLKAADVTKVVT